MFLNVEWSNYIQHYFYASCSLWTYQVHSEHWGKLYKSSRYALERTYLQLSTAFMFTWARTIVSCPLLITSVKQWKIRLQFLKTFKHLSDFGLRRMTDATLENPTVCRNAGRTATIIESAESRMRIQTNDKDEKVRLKRKVWIQMIERKTKRSTAS